jgi:hypothetical protein
LLHRLMLSESVPVVATVVDGEDYFSSVSTSAEAPSPLPTKDPSDEPMGAPLDHADAATAQAKAARVDDALFDEEEWNKRAAQGKCSSCRRREA